MNLFKSVLHTSSEVLVVNSTGLFWETRTLREQFRMEVNSERTKMKWRPQMLIDLLRCRKEAQENLKRDKQRRGLRNGMFQSWNEMGHGHLKLSVQNLYDRLT